jgi:phytoene dehydrogenase-like protein
MSRKDIKIHIVGAGVSGLIAARVLEDNGFSPIVIEATDRVGGRVKTDILNDFQLDRGFQVLLTSYPAAQKYLDLKSLDLQKFLPGASIFKDKQQKVIGDPLRGMPLLFPTLFSGIGSISDKLRILKLNNYLKKKSIDAIFSSKEQSTMSYLIDYGFSSDMISDFFKPFLVVFF